MEKELWKKVSIADNYEVSSLGRVRNSGSKILSQFDNGNGYMMVHIYIKGVGSTNQYVHRLVAQAFVPNPGKKSCINHIDYNPKNNKVSNLEWVSHKENTQHSIVHMKKPHENAPLPSTGEKYITVRILPSFAYRYRVKISTKKIDRHFVTLDEAVRYRDVILNG